MHLLLGRWQILATILQLLVNIHEKIGDKTNPQSSRSLHQRKAGMNKPLALVTAA